MACQCGTSLVARGVVAPIYSGSESAEVRAATHRYAAKIQVLAGPNFGYRMQAGRPNSSCVPAARRRSPRYGSTNIATFHPEPLLRSYRKLVASDFHFIRSHIAAARVSRIGTRHTTLVGLQQIPLGIGAAVGVALRRSPVICRVSGIGGHRNSIFFKRAARLQAIRFAIFRPRKLWDSDRCLG